MSKKHNNNIGGRCLAGERALLPDHKTQAIVHTVAVTVLISIESATEVEHVNMHYYCRNTNQIQKQKIGKKGGQ